MGLVPPFCTMSHFYPRPPRGGRHEELARGGSRYRISIHALREEGDMGLVPPFCTMSHFYPRPPRGGRRDHRQRAGRRLDFYPRPPRGGRHRRDAKASGRKSISIHALREEGDDLSWFPPPDIQYFYPRPPRGGRLSRSTSKVNRSVFLSTPSARRATNTMSAVYRTLYISIHALREEGDRSPLYLSCAGKYFYPRPPRGGRRYVAVLLVQFHAISIHALREEGDATSERTSTPAS